MKLLIVYGTSEGQTAKIAAFVAQHLTQRGHRVVVADAGDRRAWPDPSAFDAVLIAASLHRGAYQRAVVRFVREHRTAIRQRANLLLSVSLSAADARDAQGLQQCVARFCRGTGWTPDQVHHVAGALRYSRYGWLTRLVMRAIARRRGAPTDTRRDVELTDWQELAGVIDRFTASC